MTQFENTVCPAFLVLLACCTMLYADGTKTLIAGDGKANRVNIVFLAEGYTQAQQPKFISDVHKVADGFLKYSPWDYYRNYCNIYAISVVSVDSGTEHWNWGPIKDTYFEVTSDSFGTHIWNSEKVFPLLAEHVPDYHIPCVLVNETAFIGFSYGAFFVSALEPNNPSGIVLHEAGHCFAYLADEYTLSSSSLMAAESKNVTKKTIRSQIRWNNWIAPSTPIPTLPGDVDIEEPGLFEGAMYHSTGWYRPQMSCKMNASSSYDHFCKICREEIIATIHKTISLIDASFPSNATIIDSRPGTALVIQSLRPDSMSLKTEWIVNGAKTAFTADTLLLAQAGLKQGLNTVTVRVIGTTGMVRIPYNLQFLTDSLVWQVNGTASEIAAKLPAPFPAARIRGASAARGVRLNYCLDRPQSVKITLRDVRGVLRYTMHDAAQSAGMHDIMLCNGRLHPGVYVMEFVSADVKTRQLIEFVK